MISDTLGDLNKKRRKALIEYMVRENFDKLKYKITKLDMTCDEHRISIVDNKNIIISFDIDYASDFREDAYKWCYVDFFIKKPGIDIPDELKRRFTRYIDSSSKKMFWRHREMVRIIDMDKAVNYIVKIKSELEKLLKDYSLRI